MNQTPFLDGMYWLWWVPKSVGFWCDYCGRVGTYVGTSVSTGSWVCSPLSIPVDVGLLWLGSLLSPFRGDLPLAISFPVTNASWGCYDSIRDNKSSCSCSLDLWPCGQFSISCHRSVRDPSSCRDGISDHVCHRVYEKDTVNCPGIWFVYVWLYLR